jgi:hypothetical protein
MISSQPASKKKLPLMLFPPSVSKPLVHRDSPLPAPAPAPTTTTSLNVMKDGPVEKKTNRRGGKRGGRARKMTFKNVIDIDGISKYAKNHPSPAASAPAPAPAPAPPPPSQHSSTLSPPPSALAPLQKKYVSSWAKLSPSHHKAIQIDESEICLPLPLMPEGFNSQVSALDANNYFKAQLRSVILSVAL